MRLQHYITEVTKKNKPTITQKDFDATGSDGNECGPIAYVLREMGYGDIYFGYIGPKDDFRKSYPHFWVQKGGKIFDPQYDLLKEKDKRWGAEKLGKNEEPDENIWNEKNYQYCRTRIKT